MLGSITLKASSLKILHYFNAFVWIVKQRVLLYIKQKPKGFGTLSPPPICHVSLGHRKSFDPRTKTMTHSTSLLQNWSINMVAAWFAFFGCMFLGMHG